MPECGGQVRFTPDDYIQIAPELIIEVAGASLAKDLGRVEGTLRGGRMPGVSSLGDGFQQVRSEDGSFRSETFPGLWFDTAALLEDDLPQAVQTLNVGLASDEHTRLVADQASRRSG